MPTIKPSQPTPARKRTLSKKAVPLPETAKDAPNTAEARVKALLESGKPAIERAQALVAETSKSFSRQSRAIRKDISHRVADIGSRVEKERKSLGRRIESAVKTTLASLNIPTRSEINLLARRVEELSRKIDALKRR